MHIMDGCVMGSTPLSISGCKFGRLTALRPTDQRYKGNILWECVCDCGTRTTVSASRLHRGVVKSCGCSSKTAGGKSSHKLYEIYIGARKRCESPSSHLWVSYGGRGIEFKFRNFMEFLEHLEPSWFPGASLDRIDNDGHYEPGNVRWATPVQQARNTRSNRKVTYKGELKILIEVVELHGANYQTVYSRLRRGWPLEAALTIEPNKRNRYDSNSGECHKAGTSDR